MCTYHFIQCGSWLEGWVHWTSANETCWFYNNSYIVCVKCRLLKETTFNETPWTWFSKCWRMLKPYLWRAFVSFCAKACLWEVSRRSWNCQSCHQASWHQNLWRSGVSGSCVLALHVLILVCLWTETVFQMVSLISYTRLCNPLLTNRFVGSYELPWTPCLNDDDHHHRRHHHHHHHHSHIQIVQIDNVPHYTSCFQGKTLKYLDRCPSKLTWIWYIADVPPASLWVVEG